MVRSVLRVCGFVGIPIRGMDLSRSRRGWHLLVNLGHKLSNAERVALQVLCGSDPAREMYNLIRVFALARRQSAHFAARWNVLFARKLHR